MRSPFGSINALQGSRNISSSISENISISRQDTSKSDSYSSRVIIIAETDNYQTTILDEEPYAKYCNIDGHAKVSGGVIRTHLMFCDDHSHPRIAMILDSIKQGVRDYVDSKIGATEVVEIIESIYRNILVYNVANGLTSGNDSDFNEVLLRDTQATFVTHTLDELYENGNQVEGYKYAGIEKGSNANDYFVYYNAKYYYANEELQEIGRLAIMRIAENQGFTHYQALDVFGFLPDYSFDFNSRWLREITNEHLAAIVKNYGANPPKDLILYISTYR